MMISCAYRVGISKQSHCLLILLINFFVLKPFGTLQMPFLTTHNLSCLLCRQFFITTVHEHDECCMNNFNVLNNSVYLILLIDCRFLCTCKGSQQMYDLLTTDIIVRNIFLFFTVISETTIIFNIMYLFQSTFQNIFLFPTFTRQTTIFQ